MYWEAVRFRICLDGRVNDGTWRWIDVIERWLEGFWLWQLGELEKVLIVKQTVGSSWFYGKTKVQCWCLRWWVMVRNMSWTLRENTSHRSRLLSLKHMDTILNYGDHWNHPQSRWRSINMKSEVFWCLKVRRDWERMITKIFREIIIKTVFQERKKQKNDFIYFLWAWSYKDLEVSIEFDQ